MQKAAAQLKPMGITDDLLICNAVASGTSGTSDNKYILVAYIKQMLVD